MSKFTKFQLERLEELIEDLIDTLKDMNRIINPIKEHLSDDARGICSQSTIDYVQKQCYDMLDEIREIPSLIEEEL